MVKPDQREILVKDKKKKEVGDRVEVKREQWRRRLMSERQISPRTSQLTIQSHSHCN